PVVCDVASQLASALHHSHGHGVVHGDLKPDNVLCVASPADERRRWSVKLLDYGMARPITTGAGPEARIAGTPEYMAPERATGAPAQPASDVYALGVMMYEMLTGAVPFSGGSPAEILERHVREPPPPMAAPGGEPIDPRVAALVARALEKDPAARLADMVELGGELRALMDQLGLARRQAGRRPATAPGDRRDDAAADAFDALGVPAAGVRGDGVVVVANRKLCQLLRRSGPEEIEALSLLETPLGQASPDLREDLRLVAMTGTVVRRRLTLRSASGEHTLRLVMTPASRRRRPCVIVLHPLKYHPRRQGGGASRGVSRASERHRRRPAAAAAASAYAAAAAHAAASAHASASASASAAAPAYAAAAAPLALRRRLGG